MKHALRWTNVTLAAALSVNLAQAQTTARLSINSSGAQANATSSDPSISADGRFVAFTSYATNLVPGDTNANRDVFVRDRQNGTTERVSVDSAGVQSNGFSEYPEISADGRYVVFLSSATNLVAGDTNGFQDAFVHDRQSGVTERVSLSSSGAEGNGDCYVRVAISSDGRYVAFSSFASNLVVGDTNAAVDVFLRDRQLGLTERVSVDASGVQGATGSWWPTLSADARFVGFQSAAANFVPGDTNNVVDIFAVDRQLGTIVRASVDSSGGQGTLGCYGAALSADGHYLAFNTQSVLVASDTNFMYDIYIRDLQTSTTELASTGAGGVSGDGDSVLATLSVDGRFVAFRSSATNLVASDTNHRWDIFLADRQSSTTELVSISTSGFQTVADSDLPMVSSDGQFVAYHSDGIDLVPGDTNNQMDVFLRDRGLPAPASFCFGDGSAGSCPCGNNGALGHGCQNSASTGGALLSSSGTASIGADSLVLTSAGELPSASSIFLQGDVAITGVVFGDGLRCVGGVLKRLYVHAASAGSVSAPLTGDPSIHARSAALGDILSAGSPRYYQAYYRDPAPWFCPNPPGNGWNVSSGVTVVWGW